MKSSHILLWSLAGAAFILISIPFILGLVPPNRWSGFRVQKTLSDESVWYAANTVMGYDLLMAGAVILATAIATAAYARENPAVANSVNLLVMIVCLGAAAGHCFWAVGRM